MHDPFVSSHDAAARRRKTTVLALAGGVVLLTFVAWFIGSSNDEPVKRTEHMEDISFASTDLVDASRAPGESVLQEDNWEEPTTDGEGIRLSSASPSAGKSAPARQGAGAPATGPVVASVKSDPPVSSRTSPEVAVSSKTPAKEKSAAGEPTKKSSPTASPASQPLASVGKAASGEPARIARQDNEKTRLPDEKEPAAAKTTAAPQIALISPKSRHTGVVHQTRELISAADFAEIIAMPVPMAIPLATPVGVPIADAIAEPKRDDPPPATERPAESSRKSVPIPPVVQRKPPARVTQEQAKRFADILTRAWQQQGKIGKGEKIRLPSSRETANSNIWREDDPAAPPSVRKPFGLVVSDASSTRGGIPVRDDIPPGASPLEKTGPDKPLWKRPE